MKKAKMDSCITCAHVCIGGDYFGDPFLVTTGKGAALKLLQPSFPKIARWQVLSTHNSSSYTCYPGKNGSYSQAGVHLKNSMQPMKAQAGFLACDVLSAVHLSDSGRIRRGLHPQAFGSRGPELFCEFMPFFFILSEGKCEDATRQSAIFDVKCEAGF